MIYPNNFENKLGFDKVRARLKSLCLSPLGITKVDEMHFSGNFADVQLQLNQTGEFKTICQTEEAFPANHFFDLTQVLHHLKIEGTFPEVGELFNLRRSLDTIKAVYTFFKEKGETKYPVLWESARDLKLYPFVSDRINAIITNQGKIKDNASAQLATIRHDIHSKESEVQKRMHKIMKQAQAEGWADDDVTLSVRDGRLVIPVNAAHKRRIRGFIHDESATGKTSYVEPAEVVELNNDLKELEYAERREIVKILSAFADEIRPYIDDLLQAYAFLGTIDFIRAKALFAIEVNAIQPPLGDKPQIEWFNAVHPLLYLHLRSEGKSVEPLNIRLNEQQRILVISGPNAGGKSVCLQTVGLLQYMLQSGMLIPVKETSETGIFQNIFIDIGDEQSIENDLSTYSSHLMNMKFFVRNATARTLFLVDEFGTGTEPMLGGAIAESILEEMNNQKTYGVITTHYTNLKHFASSSEGIINGAMLYDSQHLQPLFKLVIGEPGSSFAFEIARKIGLPEAILQSATKKIGEEHIDFDRNLKEIIRDKHYWQQKRNQVKESGKKLDEVVSKYSSELDEISRLRKEILQKAKAEAQEMLAGVNKQIENTISAIKQSNADKEKTKLARQQIEQVKENVSMSASVEDDRVARKMEQLRRREERKQKNAGGKPQSESVSEPQQPEDSHIIKKGDKVRLFGQNNVGEVLDVNGKSIMVAFGNLTTTLHENRIEKISNNEYKKIQKDNKQAPSSKGNYDVSERRNNFKHQIDIRGQRADEALQKVTEFIDDAIMVDVNEVRILHGKGNGILRQLIRDFLKTVDLIQEYGDEKVEFGGAGITVVRFEK
jgi:DNA mismatch repair protein MutS2